MSANVVVGRSLALAILLLVGGIGLSGCVTRPSTIAPARRPTLSQPTPRRSDGSPVETTAAEPVSPTDVASKALQPNVYQPKHFGPGVALRPDLRTAPIVASGTSVRDYVDTYYRQVRAKRWKRAARMLPKSTPDASRTSYKEDLRGYEVTSYRIISAVAAGDRGAAFVVTTGANGTWHVTWDFVRRGSTLVLRTLTYARPGLSACH